MGTNESAAARDEGFQGLAIPKAFMVVPKF
jgi:hypothetical protein